MPTAIDWSKKPPPWNLIGPAFRAEVEAILGRRSAPPAELPDFSGIQLQARLIRAKISQSDLARRVGCSNTHVWGLCNGTHRGLSRNLWTKIDRVLRDAGA